MRTWHWLALAVVILIAAGVTLVAVPRSPEWTTSSPEALTEYEAGQIASRKYYNDEAREHFKKAYELDPNFLVAKLAVAYSQRREDPELADRLSRELMTADLSETTAREKFFVEYWRALRSDRPEEAARLLDRCVEEHPEDPYILERKAHVAWAQGNLDDAERLYQRLKGIDPNWVAAHNALGYIKMMRERFTEAEEHFKSYRFIAPDQANPHDSLGELYITVGRYADAEDVLERAIAMKPDFWVSYFHLALLESTTHDFEGVYRTIERARAEGLSEELAFEMSCSAQYEELADRAAWQEILDKSDDPYIEQYALGRPALITHRAACRIGDWEVARKLEDEAAGQILEIERKGNHDEIRIAQASALHMQGVRLAIQGKYGAAVERFRAVDERLSFMFVEQSMYKLFNQLLEAETLLASGHDAEAHEVIAHTRSINPQIVREFEDAGFRYLGLDRNTPSLSSANKATDFDPSMIQM